jgi:hypothetical protein
MTLTVTINSQSSSGEYFEITLEKTSVNAAEARVKTWTAPPDPAHEQPDKDELIKLYDIFGTIDATKIVCKGDIAGPDPTITCDLYGEQSPNPAHINIAIKGTLLAIGDRTMDYPVATEDYNAVMSFLRAAKFPIFG